MISISCTSQHLQQGLKNLEYGSTQQDLPDEEEEKFRNAGFGVDKEWLSKEPSCFA